jgi:hypothetical protein
MWTGEASIIAPPDPGATAAPNHDAAAATDRSRYFPTAFGMFSVATTPA